MSKEAEKRSASIRVNLTSQERKALKEGAKTRGLSISALLRTCALQVVKGESRGL